VEVLGGVWRARAGWGIVQELEAAGVEEALRYAG